MYTWSSYCICMFYDIFFIHLYNFFNQLGLLCSCQKVYYRAGESPTVGREVLRRCCWSQVQCGGKRNVFPESLLWEEKTTKSAYFTFPTVLKCFIKWRCATCFKAGACLREWDNVWRKSSPLPSPPGRFVPRVSESSMFWNGFLWDLLWFCGKEMTNIVFVGFAYCSRKSRIQFDLTYAFRVWYFYIQYVLCTCRNNLRHC